MKRRTLLLAPLGVAGALAARRLWRLATDGAGPDAAAGPLVRAAGTAFGTVVSLCALPDARRDVAASLHAALHDVQRVDALLSLHRPDSQLCRLNREGELAQADPHVLANLVFGLRLSELSQGAFDLSVQPLWDLYTRWRARGALPPTDDVARARALVDYRAVRVEGARVRLLRPGMGLTCNGLAQGYAVDLVRERLHADGLQAVLIDTGELGSLGARGPGQPWVVGLQHPRARGCFEARLAMDGRVVSTSGDYATHFSDDYRHHHIFDPRTGDSPPDWSSTVVLAPSGLVADGVSTALMVLDRTRGERLLREFPGADALWIDKATALQATRGVPFA